MTAGAAAVRGETGGTIAQNFSLTRRHSEIVERVAKLKFEGNRSHALRYILELHLDKALERAEQEAEAVAAPYAISRWKAPKISVELIAYVAGLVRAGNMPEVACNLAGITPRQVSTWMKTGRSDRRDGKESLYADFVGAVAKAEAECEAEDIRKLRQHGETTWTALAWRLERQYPDRYAQRKRIDGKVQHALVPLIDYDRLTVAETRMLVELLRKASPELNDPSVNRAARPAIELVPDDVVDAIEEAQWTEAPALEADPQVEAPALGDDQKPQP